MPKVFYLIVDQLAGHWVDDVRIEGTDLPPVNVKGYHEKGLIPNISYLIRNGLWVKRAWNRGICDTRHGIRYLATGRYARPLYHREYWSRREEYADEDLEGFFEYAKNYYGNEIKSAVFSGWYQRGYFYTPDVLVNPAWRTSHVVISGVFEWSDVLIWRNFVQPYLNTNPDFNLVHVYFPTFDHINQCPSYGAESLYASSKHAYMLFLDSLIGEMINLFHAKGIWDDLYFIIASDHGYHLGCSVARSMGVKTNNWCSDHGEPFDCEVWDFKEDRSTGIYSGGPRRITFIVSGGGLGEEYRGKCIEEAEIIDVIPTIADILNVPYKCEGRSILKMKPKDQDA